MACQLNLEPPLASPPPPVRCLFTAAVQSLAPTQKRKRKTKIGNQKYLVFSGLFLADLPLPGLLCRSTQHEKQTKPAVREQLELYVSPPRTVLKAASSLSDAGLVPAALVYVSWREVPPAGE